MRKLLLSMLLSIFLIIYSMGQSPVYSLYYFANSAINPAKINQNNNIEASGVFRSQKTTSDTDLKTAFLDLSYPFFNEKKRWSSLGLSFTSDRSGIDGIFQTDEVYLNYAVTVVLKRPNIISLGTSIRYVNSGINTDRLFTGSQFEEEFGFNPDLPLGEPFNSFNSRYLSATLGAHWKVIDKTRMEKSTLGIAIFDFNRPNSSFTEQSALPIQVLIESSYRIAYSKKAMYFVEIFHLQSRTRRSTILGLRSDLNLYRFNSQLKGHHLDLLTKYRLQEGFVFGAIWHMSNFSFGSSYDVPIGSKVSHQGAFEVTVKYQKKRIPKRKKKKNQITTQRVSRQSVPNTNQIEGLPDHSDKVDSVLIVEDEYSKYGVNIDKPVLLYFNFKFGSAEPEVREQGILEEIAVILKSDPNKTIIITGHTDNIGSRAVNMKLSFKRAQSIVDLLVELGVDPYQMNLDGKGEDDPIATNETDEGRELNRRVEIRFDNN
ncbi:MAG: PorP/SprF family type IX secretion system membrane protein [Bacteroidota bacterium]